MKPTAMASPPTKRVPGSTQAQAPSPATAFSRSTSVSIAFPGAPFRKSFSSSISPSTSASKVRIACTSLSACRANSAAELAPRGSRPTAVVALPAFSVVKKFSTLKLPTFKVPPTSSGAAGRGLPSANVLAPSWTDRMRHVEPLAALPANW